MQSETAYAKQLFMYGEGTTKPVKNIKKLAELSGAAESTLHRWTKAWRQESAELAIRAENSAFTLALSDVVITQHSEEITFLGSQVEKLRLRLRKTKTVSPNHPVYLSAYLSALTKWEKSSGILAHYETAAAATTAACVL